MIALGVVVFFLGGYLILRERGDDRIELVGGMVVGAAIAFGLWFVIMYGLGSLL